MAQEKPKNPIPLPPAAEAKILALAKAILEEKSKRNAMATKMERIDKAYARHKAGAVEEVADGVDRRPGDMPCGDVFASDNVIPPIVVSQVDSYVGYLADVFLTGTPIFPVVSPPNKRKSAEQLEVLLDDHALIGGYVRELLLMIRAGVKYNISAIEQSWDSISEYQVMDSFADLSTQARKLQQGQKAFTRIKALDMYNTVWDMSVPPAEVSKEGDYAGYIERISKTRLKRLLNKLSAERLAYNVTKALDSTAGKGTTTDLYYTNPPVIHEYTVGRDPSNWDDYLGIKGVDAEGPTLYDGKAYEIFTFYARIVPKEFALPGTGGLTNHPQIWKFRIVNNSVVVQANRVVTAYDHLPILFGQPMEDGLGYQTQSVAEGSIPFQAAASTLYNIRFQAARRAIGDRALYNADLIQPGDINSINPSAKIPVRFKSLQSAGFGNAYQSIPFDMRGTETAISDAQQIAGFAQALTGLNGPRQGQFQQGNKSVSEWQDTMAASDYRLRLPAILYEAQVFAPLKQMLALNIFQYGANVKLVSQRTGEIEDINIDELRKEVLSFRVADGYTPKARLANTDLLMSGMNLIMNAPLLQQAYGNMLPNMFAHMMSLGGVRDLDLYAPKVEQQAAAPALQQQSLQTAPVAQGAAPTATAVPPTGQPPIA